MYIYIDVGKSTVTFYWSRNDAPYNYVELRAGAVLHIVGALQPNRSLLKLSLILSMRTKTDMTCSMRLICTFWSAKLCEDVRCAAIYEKWRGSCKTNFVITCLGGRDKSNIWVDEHCGTKGRRTRTTFWPNGLWFWRRKSRLYRRLLCPYAADSVEDKHWNMSCLNNDRYSTLGYLHEFRSSLGNFCRYTVDLHCTVDYWTRLFSLLSYK